MRFVGVDDTLLARCRLGDIRAFEELCALIQQDLYRLIYSFMRNHDDTDEVLQDCLLRVFKHLSQLNDLGKFPWWLMRIAVNQCNSMRARSLAKVLYPLDDSVEPPNERIMWNSGSGESPRRALERKEMREEIDLAIRELPPKQREALILFEVEGMSLKEIAALLECSEGVVKFNLHEARKKLRAFLGPYAVSRKEKENKDLE
jgi:RNA polymerase sigma-70 factor, ECF subfamily